MATTKKTAPYGDWESPITSDFVISKTRALSAPRVCRRTGRAFYTEASDGRRTIMEITQEGPKDILPTEYSVGNTVYEYGAGLLDVLGDGRIIFSHDNSATVLDPDTKEVNILIQSPSLRYSSFNANTKTPWVLAIEEDHTGGDTAYKIKNYLVAINVSTKEVKRIATGADFYYLPQYNADGTRVAWLEWNHPEMLFNASKLYVAEWSQDGSLTNVRFITGKDNESATEPRWGLDGSTLFFAQEIAGYRQLFRIPPGSETPIHININGLETSEIGEVLLFEGTRSYAPVTERYLAASATSLGTSRLVIIDLENNSWREAADTDILSHIVWDSVARFDDSSVLVIGSGTSSSQALYKIHIHQPELNEVIRRSVDKELPQDLISKPQLVRIPSRDSPSHPIYGFLWLPQNPNYTAPEGTRLPLIIWAHGGPTGRTGSGLSPRIQYFTSRGYAYFGLNYTGSTGFGREYRNALFGPWGILDAAEAADAADYFNSGPVKAGAVGITGISAGGYHTLQCLTRHPKTFAGGICASGISEMKGFDDSTHKLEWDYARLLLQLPEDEEGKDKIYRERSAMYFVDKIESPLLLVHGHQDTVVPIEQAKIIAEALEKKGRDVKLLEFPDDEHKLSKPTNAKAWLEEEEKWWRKTLL
ncbi:Dipeptidyl peptidase family member 6 [Cladobotryum mycophilum]|uniref:Dipeptidyl peptidase family member 6 n=1 Tax=Cladobotryum mycophilum TaxID=491253 RepID=A0ABR0SKB4_9HYPO